MAYTNRDWENLGRNIQDIVDRAVTQQDYQKLNQTIRQTVERAVDLGGEAVRKAVDGRERPAPMKKLSPKEAATVQKDLSVFYGSTGKLTTGGVLKAVGGGLLTMLFGLMYLAAAVLSFVGVTLYPSVMSLVGLGGGIALLAGGIQDFAKVKRFKTYRKTLGNKTSCALETLAGSVGKSVKFVRRELKRMIHRGLFPEGHLDREQTRLIISHETYRLFEQSRLELEQRQREQAALQQKKAEMPTDPRVGEVLDKGNAFIQEIRRCNDAIPGAEISAKIDGLENIIRRIFRRAETNPEIVPELKKMMDYYLPMTVKLLNAYADMDAQPVQGQNIQNSKREIEQTLDTLNQAFEKLLDSLFADTALDVSSDISVLTTLLAQEGLTEDELSGCENKKSSP